MPIRPSVKQYPKFAVADEATLFDESGVRANENEQATPPSLLTGKFTDLLHSSSNKVKRIQKRRDSLARTNPQSHLNQRDGNVHPIRAIRTTTKSMDIIKEKTNLKRSIQ